MSDFTQAIAPNLNQKSGAGDCLWFTWQAFGAPPGLGFTYARQAWDGQHGRHPGEAPPSGVAVPVWFDHYGTYGKPAQYKNWGHAAVSLGDGRILSSPAAAGTFGQTVFGSIAALERALNAKYLGWSECMDKTPVVTPTSSAPSGGDTVIHYHREDTKARASGRIIKPGEYIYLDTRPNPKPSNATNVVGGVGMYSITPHVYAYGTPGDELTMLLVWQKGEGAQSQHYSESVVIGRDGSVFRSAEFKRAVQSGYSVWVCVQAKKSNKSDVKITCLDCDSFLYA